MAGSTKQETKKPSSLSPALLGSAVAAVCLGASALFFSRRSGGDDGRQKSATQVTRNRSRRSNLSNTKAKPAPRSSTSASSANQPTATAVKDIVSTAAPASVPVGASSAVPGTTPRPEALVPSMVTAASPSTPVAATPATPVVRAEDRSTTPPGPSSATSSAAQSSPTDAPVSPTQPSSMPPPTPQQPEVVRHSSDSPASSSQVVEAERVSGAAPAGTSSAAGDGEPASDSTAHDEAAGQEEDSVMNELAPLNELEREAEALLTEAAMSWNVSGNRKAAIKQSKAALAVLAKGDHQARIHAEASSNLGDMYFAEQMFPEAAAAIEAAIESSEACDDHPMTIKLCNNLGAVLKKCNRLQDAVGLHRKAYHLALRELGQAHDFTLLALTNFVSVLDEAGDRMGAEQTLMDAIESAKAEVGRHVEVLAKGPDGPAPMPDNATGKGVGARLLRAGADGKTPATHSEKLKAAQVALGRLYQDMGRQQLRTGDAVAALESFDVSLKQYVTVYGEGAPETMGPMFSYAHCLRKSNRPKEAMAAFEGLLELAAPRGVDENVVAVTRVLVELSDELGDVAQAAHYAKQSLMAMQVLMASKARPPPPQLMAPYFEMAIRALRKAGETQEADQLQRQMLSGRVHEHAQAARPRPSQAAAGKAGKASGKKAGRK